MCLNAMCIFTPVTAVMSACFIHFLTWSLLFLQLKNSGEIKLKPLSASLVHSVAAVPSQASVTMVTIPPGSVCDDDRLSPGKSAATPYIPAQQQASSSTSSHQERALRYFSMTQSGDPGHSEPELNSSPLLPESREKVGAPLPPTSSSGRRQHREAVEEGRREHQEEEEDRGRQQGGAREESLDSSSKGKQYSLDTQQHPQPQHSAESSLWKGKSETRPSWRAGDGDSQERRERAEGGGREGFLQEASHSSSKQEQERSTGQSQADISGRRLLRWCTLKRDG